MSRPFYLADREVWVDLFGAFADDPTLAAEERPRDWHRHNEVSPSGDCPANSVSLTDAVRFCNWLSRKEGRRPAYKSTGPGSLEWVYLPDGDGYRLPTEEEWEYAFRAGTATRFPFGRQADMLTLMRYGNIDLMSSQPGGSRMPNDWGLFDMLGNLWEICWDAGPDLEVRRGVRRGGAFGSGSFYSRSAFRLPWGPLDRDAATGFRVALGP